MDALKAPYPEIAELAGLSDETRVVVSEPLGDLAGAWNEVPESHVGIVQPGQDELRPFTPNTDLMRNVLALALGALALVFVVAYRRVLGVTQRPSWPPPSDAVTPAGAQAATEAFAARGGTRPHDAALPFAWATAATIEPWAEGVNFFPKIFADVEAASSSVHILMFGWREGEVGKRMAALLERKLAEGVEVRVIVDGFGSRPYKQAREMFTGLAAAGAQIVVNDVFPPDRDGLYPDGQQVDWRQDEIGRADHRKLYVIDGAIAWTGGAGIEDHFENGGFHDVMVRVTGDVVRQAQAAFLTSFHGHGGPLPPELSSLFPEPADPGSTPIALAQVIPGGHVAASQAIAEQIDSARQRLDLMNPYVTDRSMIDRIVAAGQRGVQVRLVISQKSNNGQATAALKHRYRTCSTPALPCGSCRTRSSTRRSWSRTTWSASEP